MLLRGHLLTNLLKKKKVSVYPQCVRHGEWREWVKVETCEAHYRSEVNTVHSFIRYWTE